MTEHKNLKRAVRTRVAKTGESYTTARSQVLTQHPPAAQDEHQDAELHFVWYQFGPGNGGGRLYFGIWASNVEDVLALSRAIEVIDRSDPLLPDAVRVSILEKAFPIDRLTPTLQALLDWERECWDRIFEAAYEVKFGTRHVRHEGQQALRWPFPQSGSDICL